MTEASLKKIISYFRTHDKAYFVLRIIYSYLPIVVYILYPLLLINNLIAVIKGSSPENFIRTLTVPAVTLISVTALRIIINKPRPYEAMDITPLFKKDTVGKSFPSRHSASVFTISMVSFGFSTAVGVFLVILGIVMCVSRVIAGVHYISDVIAGALFSVVLAIIGFII